MPPESTPIFHDTVRAFRGGIVTPRPSPIPRRTEEFRLMARHSDDDAGRADDVHDPTIDRDDFSGIPEHTLTAEQDAQAAELWANHDPAEWVGAAGDLEGGQ